MSMTPRLVSRRTIFAVTLACALLCSALSACSIETLRAEKAPPDYGEVSSAVTAAVPRVVEVRDLGRSLNGFSYRLSLSIVTDSADPFTGDELDALVEAIWRTLPWEPNTIELTAGAEPRAGDGVVDLRAAAATLEPLGVTNAGQGGVSLTDMDARYGDWKEPK
ncbi:hypothetical protein ASE12_08965 [Aeromicrobium sp. Root236]|nr:hypothetical protein ASE12_08965 [Aeromicrobium sp. Root236]